MMLWCRRTQRRCLRRGPRRDGCGQGHRDVLHVRTSSGTLLRQGQHRLPPQQEDPGAEQVGEDRRDIQQEASR